jgi:hypothetical protein
MCKKYEEHQYPEYYTDPNEMIKKITKYLIEGFVIALVLRWLPSNNLSVKEIAVISLIASGTLIMLDTYSPTISSGYRNGIGLALGAKTVLLPKIII